MLNIRLVKEEDLEELAKIYKELYGESILNEDWSIEKAESMLNFFYRLQPDIFLVAEVDKKVVGG